MMTRLAPPPIPPVYPGHLPEIDLQPQKVHVRCSHVSESESKPSTFKGSALVSALLEIDRKRFQSRAVALHFARRLFRLGLVRSIFGASNFEDSVQVYCWHNGNDEETHSTEPRHKNTSNVTQRSSWMTNVESSSPLSNNSTNSYYSSIHSKRLHSSPHHTDQNQPFLKNRPHVDSQFVDIVRTKLLSIGEPAALNSYPYSDSLESNQTKLRTDHGLGRIRKSSKAFQPQTCTIPHSFTPDSKAVTLSSSPLYQDRVISTRHKNNISPKMEDVSTAKYLNEKDIFALEYDTSSKAVENQVFQICRNDCEISPLRMSGCSSLGSNSVNGVVVGGRNVWSSGGIVGSGGGGCVGNNGAGNSTGGGVGSVGCTNNGGGGSSSSSSGSSNGGVGGGGGTGGVDSGNGGCSDPCSSYSDNEKQLIEEINRIRREHEHVLRTYEDRISRMTVKMHELRNIAEMLENSSNKSLPYGVIQDKGGQTSQNGQPNHHLNHHNHNNQHHLHQQQQNGSSSSVTCQATGHCTDPEAKSSTQNTDKIAPPPLPPRNDRGTAKVYPNKPLIHNKVKLTQVPWTRIITNTDDENMKGTIWNSLGQTDIDTQEIERFFEESPTKATVFIQSLYDDVSLRCGALKPQPISIIDSTKCQQMTLQMKQVRCTFSDVVHALLTLSIETLRFANAESLSELFQLMSSGNDIEIIAQQDRRISNLQMDCPEYFLYELSGMEMLRERLDFLRFKLRLLTDLFETDQRLRAVNTACDELNNSLPLKNLIEVMVCTGNYMNGGTPLGQADGFQLDILPKLKDILAKNNKSNFLEYVITVYCQKFENEPGLQTNRTFRLPNAIVVRYASQISFDEMQKNLQGWKTELINTRNKIHSNLVVSTSRQVEGFRNAVDYFLSAGMETMEEQKKFLCDTKDYCIKLLSYFSFEMNGQGSIQQFFFMWSQFLHECKHYWKISHQRLAEERFRKGLNQKIKMMNITNMDKFTIPSSCPELPPRIRKQKSSTEKQPPPPPINIIHKKWEDGSSEDLRFHQLGPASHNQHNGCSNSDSSGHLNHYHLSSKTLSAPTQFNANSHPSHHIKAYKSREDLHDFQAQPSPKPLTSRPPNTSDIHKPKPLNPVPTSHEGSPLLGLCHKMTNNIAFHNYMNQSPLAVRPTSSPVVANSGTTTNPMEVAEVAPKRPPPHHLHHLQANTLTSRETAGVAVPSITTTPMVPSVSNSNSSSSHHHHHSSSTATSLSSSGGSNKNGTNINNSTTSNSHIESAAQKRSTHQLFKSWLKREQTKTNGSEQGTLSSKLSSNDKSKVTAFKPVSHGSEEPVRAPKIYTRAKAVPQTSMPDSRDGHPSSHDLTSSGNSSKNGSTSHGQEHGNSDPKQFQSHSNSLNNKIGSKDQLYSPRYEQSPMSSSEKLTHASEKKTANGEEKSQHQAAKNHYQQFSGPPSPQKSISDPGSCNNGHLPLTSSLTSSASAHRNYQNDVELITGSSTTPKSCSSNNHVGQQYHYVDSNHPINKPRDRAPLALGSNVGISDMHRSELLSKNGVIDSIGSDQTIEKVSNQPVSTGHGHSKSNSTTASSMGSYAHEIQTKSRKYFTTNTAQQSTTNNMSGIIGCKSQSSQILKNMSGISSDLRGSGTQGSSLSSSGNGNSNSSSGQHRSSSAYSYSQKMAREEAAAAISPRTGHHTEGRSSKLAAVNGDRLPMSAPSISSLIERFEKVQHVGDSSVKHTSSKSNEANNCDLKHMALASTPVSSRKRLFGEPAASTSTSTTHAGTNKSKSNAEDSNTSEDEYAVHLDRAVSPQQNPDPEDPSRRQRYQTMDIANGRKPDQNEYSPVNGENSSSLLRGSYHSDNFNPTNNYTHQLRETAKNTNILSEIYPNIQQTPERPPPLVASSAAVALANQKGHNKKVIRAHENMAYMAV